jgi:ATP-binding cassette subfamily B protein
LNSTFKNMIFALKSIESPLYIIFNIIYKCINDMKWAVLTVIFVKKLTELIESKSSVNNFITVLSVFAAIFTSIIIFSNFFEHYYKPGKLPKIQGKLKEKLFACSIQSDISNFDNSDFYNDYIWTMTNIEQTMLNIIDDVSKLISNIVITVLISNMFISINIFIMMAVILSVGITVFIYSFIIKINFAKDIAVNPFHRKAEYFKRVFYLKDYSKELRITNIGELLKNQFDSNEKELCSIYGKFGKKLMLANLTNGITISTLLDIGLRILLTYQLMVTKTITLGEFAASSLGIWSLFSSLNGLMYGFNCFPEHNLRIQKMKTFMNRSPRVYTQGREAISHNKKDIIKFSNVSFSYTGVKHAALNKISFSIKQGEKIALVGENGSGKSTLVKLLLGLYEPTSGEILVNDQKLKDLSIEEYRKMFGIVFQDFSIFAANVAQNVVMDLEYDKTRTEEALKKSLFYSDDYLKSIPLEAILTKEFDDKGIVLSGGQAQKLIIARAFLDTPIVIMDEPSSSLDVDSETRLNNAVLNETSDKAVIVISHRLTTAMRADRIIVLSQGKIIEEGTHDELMRKKGQYEKMFTIQAKQYTQLHT